MPQCRIPARDPLAQLPTADGRGSDSHRSSGICECQAKVFAKGASTAASDKCPDLGELFEARLRGPHGEDYTPFGKRWRLSP